MGATVALPLLDAMVPALSAKSLKSTPRLGFVYAANGVIQNRWIPATTGRNFELSPILKPLESVKTNINVLSGLSHLQADTFGDGTGDHPRSSAVWLTGVHAYDRSRPDVEVRLATSADQIAAREIGKATQFFVTQIANREAVLRAQVTGSVLQTYADQGQAVSAGTVLARIDAANPGAGEK